ncbi:MAG TPA: hypothetical protein DCZ69_01685 [Syntrophobacteraceae bacterium]|nr:hypothetical protein [Syntrophobacteraceae bacterium]HBZ56344.1 hypothetical protein [Syntrophobacteraceae bacterium]
MEARWQRLEQEIEELKVQVAELQERLMRLGRTSSTVSNPVEVSLRQRGLPVLAHGDHTRLLLPSCSSPEPRTRWYELLRRYSFRLFVRDLLQVQEGSDLTALSRYCTVPTVRRYLRELQELGLVILSADGAYRLVPDQVTSFGPTLEWYVGQVLQREFLAPALFSVRLLNTQHGGDYDVIAVLDQRLLYVEAKSSPPRGVELPAVEAFLGRLEDLQPEVAVFLVDTELRMRDKIVELFQDALTHRFGPGSGSLWPVERLVEELFHIGHAIYLINSRKGIYTNIRLCMRDFRRWEHQVRRPWAGLDG